MAIDKNTESSATRQIDAPAAAIFDILSNPQRHAETDGHALAAIAGQVLPALDALEQLPSSR